MIVRFGRQFRRTTLLVYGYGAVLAGLAMAHSGKQAPYNYALVAGAGVCLCFWRRSWLTLLLVVAFGVACGWWRGSLYMQKLHQYYPIYGHEVTLTVQSSDDSVYGKNSQVSFSGAKARLDDGRVLAGRLQLSGFGVNAIYQGDRVQVVGKLYPGFGAYQGRISYAHLRLIGHYPSPLAEIRRKFTAGMQSALPEPLAPFAMGLLIGQRATLPADIKQDLLMVGLTHIIAVSGYNLTIILHASQRLLAKRSKRVGVMLSCMLIIVFLLLTGGSASIVRAAIVSMLSIWTAYYGRAFRPVNLILLAAAITAWSNPFYLWSDLSWYLSFLAFFGVLVLAPLITRRFSEKWQQSVAVQVAIESFCAELMTLPLILHVFGQMSFVGLPANVLVVTLVPLAMLCSAVAGLAGMIAGSIAGWVAWPAVWLLTYMLDTAHLLASLPHIFVQNIGLSLAQMLGLYGWLMLVTMLLTHKTKQSIYAKITDKTRPNSQGVVFERTQQMVNH